MIFFNVGAKCMVHMISWGKTTLPKSMGGIGLSYASTLYQLCKGRLLWNISHWSSLLSNCLIA